MALMLSKALPFYFFPAIEGQRITARFELQPGIPSAIGQEFVSQLEQAAYQAQQRLQNTHNSSAALIESITSEISGETGRVQVQLIDSDLRTISNEQYLRQWRALIQPISQAQSFSLQAP